MALTTIPASLSATALTLTTAAQPNITSVGTLTGLTVSGNIAGTLTTAAQTNITSVGTLTTLTVDDITINGSTISDAGSLTIDSGGDINLDADGADIVFLDGGTQFGQIRNNSGLYFISNVSDASMYLRGNDGGSYVNALTIDFQSGGNVGVGAAPVSGYGNLQVRNSFAYINEDGSNTKQMYLRTNYGTGNPAIQVATAHDLLFATSNATRMTIDSGGNVGIGNTSPLQAHTEGITIGPRTILSDVVNYQTLLANNAYYKTGNVWKSVVATGGGYSAIRMYNGLFRVHTGTVSAADETLSTMDSSDIRLHIGTNGNVGIGTTSPSSYFSPQLVVHSSSNLGGITIRSNATTDTNYLLFADGTSGNERYRGYVSYDHNADTMKLATGASPAITIDSSSKVGIGTTSPLGKVHIRHDMYTGNNVTELESSQSVYGSLNFEGLANTGAGSTATTQQGITWRVNNYNGSTDYGNQAQLVVGNNGDVGTFMGFFTSDNYSSYPRERMRIDSLGNVTKPNHPCFVVHLGANATYNSGVRPLNGTGWTSVHANIGSHFSTSTGKFTAPVAGMYSFTVNLCTNSAAAATTYWSAEIYVNTTRVLGGWNEHTAGYQRTEATYVRYLSAGDTVHAGMETQQNITILGNAGSSAGGQYSRFEGYLIG